jgi:hypothetical protein
MVAKELQRHETTQRAKRLGHLGNPYQARGVRADFGRFVTEDELRGPVFLDQLGRLQGAFPGGAGRGYEDEQVV